MGETNNVLKSIKGISERDRKMIEDAENLLGPEPEEMGLIKNMFWSRMREELLFPYPEYPKEEKEKCDQLLEKVKAYFEKEHPRIQIDQDQEIPGRCIKRLFELGVMGMIIPEEYGGLGLGVTSYNRVLEVIGSYCSSTSVMVSAHQSIGCKGIVLFGNQDQKVKWLPRLAKDMLSAFCLSEPNVGCDAGGQETECYLSDDGKHYILNGEKKWSTSGAISGVFTVMSRLQKPGEKGSKKINALICTPDMEGIDVFQKNRSKCGIRGTWQARIRFDNVKVPVENLLHKEGKGLQVALTCLNYGRCTLSAGMVGSAKRCRDQAIKWARTRYQFSRPLSDFELVKEKISEMDSLCYAMDAMLYATTGMLDRHDKDIMVETATCKVFCSEMGFRVINHAMQIMGGEGYMTENEVERAFRDSRIYPIVEGANEVMQSFIFAYGGKQLAESMLNIREALTWNGEQNVFSNLFKILRNSCKPKLVFRAVNLAFEIFLKIAPQAPDFSKVDPRFSEEAEKISEMISQLSLQFKRMSYVHGENILNRQTIQARLADVAMWIHAINCSLAKLDRDSKSTEGVNQRDLTRGLHFIKQSELHVKELFLRLDRHADDSMLNCSEEAIKHNSTLNDSDFVIPEKSPVAEGKGRSNDQSSIQQFPGDQQKAKPFV